MNHKIRKIFIAVLSFMLVFALAGCGGPADTSPLSKEEIKDMFADADKYKGKAVKDMPIVMSQVIGADGNAYQYQGYNDSNYENTIIFESKEDLKLSEDDYVLLSGEVKGKIKYETLMGGKTSAPMIINAVAKVADVTIFNQTEKMIEVGETKKQKGISITLERVEIAEKSTRCFFKINNGSSDKISIYSFNSFIKQGSSQYDEAKNSYEENTLKSELNKGVDAEGSLNFEKLKSQDEAFKVTLDISSDNWDANLKPFVFNVMP
ncbi:MAG: hypothetical protein ACRCUS_05570 [Anaerovoracaceae bacterium]